MLRIEFEEAAEEFAFRQRPDLFSEPFALSNQRKLTLTSFDLIRTTRPDIHVFSELALRYTHGRHALRRQVVPDVTLIVSDQPVEVDECYSLPSQPGRLTLVMDHVCRRHNRKDYSENLERYERELKVAYYLRFSPDSRELELSQHNGRRYVPVKPDAHGRLSISALDVEVAILDGWVRYWFQGRLVPLIGELQQELARFQARSSRPNKSRKKS